MGIGKVLPTLVIISISAMMMFSILPAMAHISTPEGVCPGGPAANGNSPWHMHIGQIGQEGDANLNGHTCHNHRSDLIRDDRIPRS